MVGFSLNYLSQALCCLCHDRVSYGGSIPELKIVLGGGLVTSWMKRPRWQNPFRGLIDELVPGPGEDALLAP